MGTIPHKVKGIERVSFKLQEKDKVSTVNLHNALYVSNNLISISISTSDKASLHSTMGNGLKVFDWSWKYFYTATVKNIFMFIKVIITGNPNLMSRINI